MKMANVMTVRWFVDGEWSDTELDFGNDRVGIEEIHRANDLINRTGKLHGHPAWVKAVRINGRKVETQRERDAKRIDAHDGDPMICGTMSNGY
jgi:hypothetical protein